MATSTQHAVIFLMFQSQTHGLEMDDHRDRSEYGAKNKWLQETGCEIAELSERDGCLAHLCAKGNEVVDTA